jgi:hypothetical protein
MALRLAYIYGMSARVLYKRGASGPAQRMYNEAYKSLMQASKWISSRLTKDGQWADSGKVESPGKIAARSAYAATLIKKWFSKAPELTPYYAVLRGFTPAAIAARQEAVGEKPGAQTPLERVIGTDLPETKTVAYIAAGAAILIAIALASR